MSSSNVSETENKSTETAGSTCEKRLRTFRITLQANDGININVMCQLNTREEIKKLHTQIAKLLRSANGMMETAASSDAPNQCNVPPAVNIRLAAKFNDSLFMLADDQTLEMLTSTSSSDTDVFDLFVVYRSSTGTKKMSSSKREESEAVNDEDGSSYDEAASASDEEVMDTKMERPVAAKRATTSRRTTTKRATTSQLTSTKRNRRA